MNAAAASPAGDPDAPVEVHIHVHEAAQLYAADSNSTSDSFVSVQCFGQSQETRVVRENLNPFFDEMMMFKGFRRELKSVLSLDVYDYDLLSANDFIGSYSFDLESLLARPYKEFYRAWVTLLDTSGERKGPQGKVCVSLTVMEIGDEFPPRPGVETPPEESDLQPYALLLACHHAEGLPRSNARQFVSVSWAGMTATTTPAGPTEVEEKIIPDDSVSEPRAGHSARETTTKTIAAASTSHKHQIRAQKYIFKELLELPIIREENRRAPQTSDAVLLQLQKADRTKTRTVATCILSVKDVADTRWDTAHWLNFYGAPHHHDPELASPPRTWRGDAENGDAEKMNCGHMVGSCYRGRLLLSAKLVRAVRHRGERTSTLDPSVVYQPPDSTWYTLRARICVGCDMPADSDLIVRMTWGGDGKARTTVKHTTDTGLGLWDEVIKLVLPFPSDDPEWTQIPDIFLELINQGNGSAKRRSHFCRIPLGQFRPDPLANGRWQLSGWQIWNLDAVSAGAHSVENLLKAEPRMFVQLEVERQAGEYAQHQVPRNIAVPHKVATACTQSSLSWHANHKQCHFSFDEYNPMYQPFELKVCVYMARNLIVGDASSLTSDPFVSVSVIDTMNMKRRTETTSVVHDSRCPQWFQTLEFHQLMLPSPTAQSRELQMAPGVSLAVYDDDGPTHAPELIGRLYVPMHLLSTKQFAQAQYMPLHLPLADDKQLNAGEILVLFELCGPSDISTIPMDPMPADTELVDVSAFIIGCRDLIDRVGRFSQKVDGRTWIEATLSAGNHQERTDQCSYPTASQPTYLQLLAFNRVELPREALFSPTLSFSVCQQSMMPGRTVLGTALLDLTSHFTAYLQENKKVRGSSESRRDARTPQLPSRPGLQGETVHIEKGGIDPIDMHERVRAIQDFNAQPPSMSPTTTAQEHRTSRQLFFQRGDILRVQSKDPLSDQSLEGTVCGKPEAVAGLFPKSSCITIYVPAKFGDFQAGLKVGDDPEWMHGRGLALDELEKVFDLSDCANLPLAIEKNVSNAALAKYAQEQTLASSLELPSLKLYVVITDPARGADRIPRPLGAGHRMISTPTPITIRLYVVRAANLAVADVDTKSADPYLDVYLDAAFGTTGGAGGVGKSFWPGEQAQWAYQLNCKGRWPKGCSDDPSSGSDRAGSVVQPMVTRATRAPYWGQPFEWNAVLLPGPAKLTISVWDKDKYSSDDLIGSTTIDVETRFFSSQWQQLGRSSKNRQPVGESNKPASRPNSTVGKSAALRSASSASTSQLTEVVRKPAEWRDLHRGGSPITQGKVQCWLEAFPASDARLYPYVDISPPKKEMFELRVIVWHAAKMLASDYIGDMNDLFFVGHLLYRDDHGRIQDVVQETDTHLRAKNGNGNFNYRFVFKNIQLPLEQAEDDLPRFTVQAWDADLLDANDQIGSHARSLRPLFNTAWRKFSRWRDRDAQIEQMATPELATEIQTVLATKRARGQRRQTHVSDEEKQALGPGKVEAAEVPSRASTSEDRTPGSSSDDIDSDADEIEALMGTLAQKQRRQKLQALLRQIDPVRQLSFTSTRMPETEPKTTSLLKESAGSRIEQMRAGCSCAGSFGGCVAMILDVLREICCWLLTCQICRMVSDAQMNRNRSRGAPADWWTLRGPLPPAEFDDNQTASDEESRGLLPLMEGSGSDKFGWGRVGKVCLSLEVLPQELAEQRPAGEGRKEPNAHPFLEEPEREALSFFNPIGSLRTLLGDALFGKLGTFACCVMCFFFFLLTFPMLLSNVLSDIISGVSG